MSLLSCRDVLETLRDSNGPINGEIECLPLSTLAFILQLAENLSCVLFELVEGTRDRAMIASAQALLDWSRFAYSAKLGYESELNTRGLCPRTLGCISRLSLVSAWAHASHVHLDAAPRNHTECSLSSCRNLHAVEGQYGVIHNVSSCKCANMKPDKSKVFELLKAGKVPIFEILWEDAKPAAITVQSSEDRPYCAISHVWAEGLGSVTESGLPTCQLIRLHQKLGGKAFWIDALGVPLDRDYRKMAILDMAQVYREAGEILVIDATLLKYHSNTSPCRLLFQLYISNWLSRLWTLQECLLARSLVIALEDRNVPFLDILKASFSQEIRTPLLKALCDRMMMLVPQLSSVSYTQDKGMSLRALVSGLQNRSTSRPIDETVAISALANVDVKPLLDLDQDDRMLHFLKNIRNLPADIIFGRVKRLTLPGFTWAPQSLMQPLRLGAPPHALCTEDGIQATYNLMKFTKQTFRDQHVCHFSIAGIQHSVTVGLIRDGETTATGTSVDCDSLLLRGAITSEDGKKAGSCLATGVSWLTDEPYKDGSLSKCKFQSAGFTVIWSAGRVEKQGDGLRRVEATLSSRMVRLV